jgi:hypothetical protein
MILPSIGRIVHYISFGTPGGEHKRECRAAIVTAVPDEAMPRLVDLAVLNPTGFYFNQGCEYHEDAAAGGTWHWPERVPS